MEKEPITDPVFEVPSGYEATEVHWFNQPPQRPGGGTVNVANAQGDEQTEGD